MRHAILLAGGRGKRFWPRSRRARPKQFLPFGGRRSLLELTSWRLQPVIPPARQWVITNREYVDVVRELLPNVPQSQIIGEPRGLNTAPAIGVAATMVRATDPDAVLVVQAADHYIGDVARFRALVRQTFQQVEKERRIGLIGFAPTRPATGFGYIERGDALASPPGFRVNSVRAFHEKPNASLARRYLRGGRHLWNGCMFVWYAETILDGLGRFQPALAAGLGELARRVEKGGQVERALARLYRDQVAMAIEPALIERVSGDCIVLEGDCGWEDLGTWGSLAEVLGADAAGNVAQGPQLSIDTRDCVVLADQGVIATLGIRGLIVVKEGDRVLVADRSREGELSALVEALELDPRLRDQL